MDELEAKAAIKRNVMHTTLYMLRRLTDEYDGVRLPVAPECDFDDVLVLLNLAIAKLDAIDAHPAGEVDLAEIERTHLRLVQ